MTDLGQNFICYLVLIILSASTSKTHSQTFIIYSKCETIQNLIYSTIPWWGIIKILNFQVEDSLTFLNTMERQSIIQQMLNNLRAIEGDQLLKIKFVEGQAISKHLLVIKNNDSNQIILNTNKDMNKIII